MTDDLRLRVAKRLCQMFWAYMGDPDRTADEQWQRESRSDCWLALADAILPLLAIRASWTTTGQQPMICACPAVLVLKGEYEEYEQAREKFLGEDKT